jgi:hypothetical protein
MPDLICFDSNMWGIIIYPNIQLKSVKQVDVLVLNCTKDVNILLLAQIILNCIDGVIVTILASCVVDCGFWELMPDLICFDIMQIRIC